jgi:hypothetical protein
MAWPPLRRQLVALSESGMACQATQPWLEQLPRAHRPVFSRYAIAISRASYVTASSPACGHGSILLLDKNRSKFRDAKAARTFLPCPSHGDAPEGQACAVFPPKPRRLAFLRHRSRRKPDQIRGTLLRAGFSTWSAKEQPAKGQEPSEPVQCWSVPQWCSVRCWPSGYYRGARRTVRRRREWRLR